MNKNKLAVIFLLLAIIALLLHQNEVSYAILSVLALYVGILLYRTSKQTSGPIVDNDFEAIPVGRCNEIRYVSLVLNRGNVFPISEKNPDTELERYIL